MTIDTEHRRLTYDADLPLTIELDGGDHLTYLELLRLVPGRRAVFRALWQRRGSDVAVVAKVFFGRSSHRRADREERGLSCLRVAEIPAPLVLARRRTGDAELVLLEDLGRLRRLDEPETFVILRLFETMAAKGVRHLDLHRGNIVQNEEGLFVLDGAAVSGGRFDSIAALARWHAEFPVRPDAPRSARRSTARASRLTGGNMIASTDFAARTSEYRARRAKAIAAKVFRDTSAVRTAAHRGMRWCADRGVPIGPADIEGGFAGSADFLKSGRTATVVLHDGMVIKRQNRKSWWHGARTSLRASRGARGWANMHAARALGLPVPKPIALLEYSAWGYRTLSYFAYQYAPGSSLDEIVAASGWQEHLIDATVDLFECFRSCRFTHGDCKASNYLVADDGGIVVLDLDTAAFHPRVTEFRRQFAQDLERFLANWTDAPTPLVDRLQALIESS